MIARRWSGVLRDVLVVAAVALVTFQALKRTCGDYYRVPTRSMEPTLHGDPDQGDVVFVETLSRATSCRRHDLVVVRNPSDPAGQLVKRLAANGDDIDACWINLLEGDVWLGPTAQHMHRETKDPVAARALRVPWARWPGGSDEVAQLRLPPTVTSAPADVPPLSIDAAGLRAACRQPQREVHRALAGAFATARAVDATFLDAEGRRGHEGEDVGVRDVGIDATVAADCDAVVAVLTTHNQALTFLWRPAAGRVEVWRDGEDFATCDLPPVTDGWHRIELGRLDERVFFLLDGGVVSPIAVDCPSPRPVAEALPIGPRSHVHLTALGARPLRVQSLLVFRDVHAYREPVLGFAGQGTWPMHVMPGQWFLLGDNSFDSRDSRGFGPVPADGFLGRPLAVIGPWRRTRWLAP